MNIIKTNLKDCYIIKPDRFDDERGYFKKIESRQLEELGFEKIVQINESKSEKGTVRGLHFQENPFSQAKLVRCINGEVLDVAVDLRVGSPTYGKWTYVNLTPENHNMLYIPRGFAHGFVALKDNTVFEYYIDNIYMPSHERGIIWNDPDINIDWKLKEYGIDEPIISEKDQKHLTLKESPEYFREVK